ncbi:MAG: enoyl-CoA hydratase/isomerase family protein [Thermoplasmata archaeon]|nr:enoyl-CoA hydratase/isomerase family protein [Thermoplasmata archaeon]
MTVSQAGPGGLVLVERRGPVAILTLNNPPLNIITGRLLEDLAGHILELSKDASVRVLVIAGAGDRAFSGGANIKDMVTMDRAEASAFSTKGQAVANLLERSPLPVIAAVHGFCLGGGCELSQACDFIIASEDAVFGQPEIDIGVIPGWGGSRRLTRAVGVVRARRWILTGEQIPAKTAFKYGLLDRVVPNDRLMEEAMALARELAAKPAVAVAAAKYAVNQAADPSRLLGLEYERELWGLLFDTDDQKEGMKAFLEKRPASFPDQRDWTRQRPEFPWERPGNPLEIAKEQVYQSGQDPSGGLNSVTRNGPFDMLVMAEAYREAGLRAFQAFFALMRNATDSYRFWAQVALQDSPSPPSGRTRVGDETARKS